MILLAALSLASCLGIVSASLQNTIAASTLSINNIPYSTRAHWMRVANAAVADVGSSPCPFGAFGSVVVNHSSTDGLGELVCISANAARQTGNPTLHTEMAAIANCTAVLTDPKGRFNLSASETRDAFKQLSLYTNAESCAMCASTIRIAGFREYIYGTSIDTLVLQGWSQIRIPSLEIFRQSFDLPSQSRLIGGILTNETDPFFMWQSNPDFPCPSGCSRMNGTCAADK